MLKTPRQCDMIVNSFAKVFATGDIENLTNSAYHFLMLCPGFIAHYNLGGFRGHYEDVQYLMNDIVRNLPANQWKNFTERDQDYAYRMQEKEIYNRVVEDQEIYNRIFAEIPVAQGKFAVYDSIQRILAGI
jgi:hypothetical protein